MGIFHVFLIVATCVICCDSLSNVPSSNLSTTQTLVWGPGLNTEFTVPVRYFYIQAVFKDGRNASESVGEKAFSVAITSDLGARKRIWIEVLDRHDGSYLVRYRLYGSYRDLSISVTLNHAHGSAEETQQHIAQSPYLLPGIAYHEKCDCPRHSADEWAQAVGCPVSYDQIDHDLAPFQSVDISALVKQAVHHYSTQGYHSICHYKVKDNKVYRKCYGQHVGFKMFSDAILLSLTRKMVLPDMELVMNLGDWPLVTRRSKVKELLPVMSWCGSHESSDIVLPTYDITEATLEMMGRVSLDMFSTSANTGPRWENKTGVAFWRGRDSRQERLDLVQMSRRHPGLVDAALTNMFFFPKDEQKYGAIQKQISFFDFFKWKYQLNIDGTVAAYRLPYLLAGDAVVFKQESAYYEHFYRDLQPFVHYVPLKHDLSDVLDKVKWAKDNDQQAHQIARNGQDYARTHLNPDNVLCYHTRLFQHYSKLLKNQAGDVGGFESVQQPEELCDCQRPPPPPSHPEHPESSREEL